MFVVSHAIATIRDVGPCLEDLGLQGCQTKDTKNHTIDKHSHDVLKIPASMWKVLYGSLQQSGLKISIDYRP